MFNAPPPINRRLYQTHEQRLLIVAGLFVVLNVTVITGIVLIVIILTFAGIIDSEDPPALAVLIYAMVFGSSIAGLIKLARLFRRPVDYMPKLVAGPLAQGQPFDVRLMRKTLGPAFSGAGVVRFSPTHLIIEGQREISSYVQLGIFLVLAAASLLTICFTLLIIPAALAATRIGRQQMIQQIPYAVVRAIAVDGNTVTLETPAHSPAKTMFYVASADGPRLHAELDQHFGARLRRPAD